MATVASGGWESVVEVCGVTWDTYFALRENPDNDRVRMTYDAGTLELMERSPKHGRTGHLIDSMIGVWTEELSIPICGFGGMTCQRKDVAKGFEPDYCYYVPNCKQSLGKWEFDFAIDPPPDLAIEIEMSHKAMQKINSVYAGFALPEVWRFDGSKLHVYEFANGSYRPRHTSLCLPKFPLAKIDELAQQNLPERHQELVRGFRRWVRETFVAHKYD